jgi:hypothetical protein
MPKQRDPSPMTGVEEWEDEPSKPIPPPFFGEEDKFVGEPEGYSLPREEKPGKTNPFRYYPKRPRYRDINPPLDNFVYSADTAENKSRSSSTSSVSDGPISRPKRLRLESSQSDIQTDSLKASEKKKPRKGGLKRQNSKDVSMFEKTAPRKGETVFDITNNLGKLSIDETPKEDKARDAQRKARSRRTPSPPAEPSKPRKPAKPPIKPTEGESSRKLHKRSPKDSNAPKKEPRNGRTKPRKPKDGDSSKKGKEEEKVGEVNKKA